MLAAGAGSIALPPAFSTGLTQPRIVDSESKRTPGILTLVKKIVVLRSDSWDSWNCYEKFQKGQTLLQEPAS